MKFRLSYSIILTTIFLVSGCFGKVNPKKLAKVINENITLPAGSYQVNEEDLEVDNSITISPTSGTMGIQTGGQSYGSIPFNAPKGNITGAGMRFGSSGPINIVPISGVQGRTSGTLNIPFSMSSSTCNNLSQICHDIKCYEFAITDDGKISQANIRDVAIMCGNCDEPSCKDIINIPCDLGTCVDFEWYCVNSVSPWVQYCVNDDFEISISYNGNVLKWEYFDVNGNVVDDFDSVDRTICPNDY